jgi:Mrp family chromosome partitioning ATPase
MGTPLKQEQLALLSDYDTGSAYHAAYQRLFANIRFGWENTGAKQHAILLAAPAPFSTYATTAANLAIIAAQSGTPTVLVDADLKTPVLQKRFGTPEIRGLSDLLSEGFSRSQALFSVLSETFVPQLRLLSAGNSLPQVDQSALLLANRLGDVLNGLRQMLSDSEGRSGLIVFHAPPVLSSIDTAQIGSLVDQTFLIIAKGETTRTQARQAQEQLERAHATISGLVLLES